MRMTPNVNHSRFDFNLMFLTLGIFTTEGTNTTTTTNNNNIIIIIISYAVLIANFLEFGSWDNYFGLQSPVSGLRSVTAEIPAEEIIMS